MLRKAYLIGELCCVVTVFATPGRAGSDCHLHNPADWQGFLAHYAADPRWAITCEEEPCEPAFYQIVASEVQGTFLACAQELAASPGVQACTAALRRFYPAWLRAHDATTYGFNLANAAYFAQQEGADRPEGMMDPPPDLIAALPERARVEAVAREHGWKYLTHRSAIRGTRTFVFLPEALGRFDQWLVVSYADGGGRSDTRTPIAFLAVQKADRAGHPQERVRVHFRSYALTGSPSRWSLPEAFSGKCFNCHPSGTRQLINMITAESMASPVRGEAGYSPDGGAPSIDLARQRLHEFNKILASYGLPDWETTVQPEDFGPILGAELGCTACHNGVTRASLRLNTSMPQIAHKIIDEMAMPPVAGLQALLEAYLLDPSRVHGAAKATLDREYAAREDLLAAFAAKRMQTVTAWLLATPCN